MYYCKPMKNFQKKFNSGSMCYILYKQIEVEAAQPKWIGFSILMLENDIMEISSSRKMQSKIRWMEFC